MDDHDLMGDPTIHHFIPRSRGGEDRPNRNLLTFNMTVAHQKCNSAWSDRMPALTHWWRFFWFHAMAGRIHWPWTKRPSVK